MDDTRKLLMALIDALGFEVEETKRYIRNDRASAAGSLGYQLVDYKVAPKAVKKYDATGWNSSKRYRVDDAVVVDSTLFMATGKYIGPGLIKDDNINKYPPSSPEYWKPIGAES